LAARVWRIVVQPKNSCRPPAAEEPLRMGLKNRATKLCDFRDRSVGGLSHRAVISPR